VSREVARHGGRPLYRASEADRQAWESALRPKACLLANHEQLRMIVGYGNDSVQNGPFGYQTHEPLSRRRRTEVLPMPSVVFPLLVECFYSFQNTCMFP
jgi:hypothetical protein